MGFLKNIQPIWSIYKFIYERELYYIDKQQLVTLHLIVFQTNNKIVDVNIKGYKYRLFTLKTS